MKTQNKLFKKASRKIAVLTVAMMVLQPLLLVAVAPAKTFAAVPVHTLSIANHIVISEVQITGGAGQTDNEFIELYNPTASTINLSTLPLKLHIRNSSGVDGNKTLTFADDSTIPSNGFFLIAPNNAYGSLVNADATYSVSSGNKLVDNGGVYISNSTGDDTGVIDKVGWNGQPSGGYEQTAFGSNPPANQSIERKANAASTATSMASGGVDFTNGNAWDTDNNSADFILKTTSEPQNSSSLVEDIIAPSTPDVSKITVNQNSPGTNDMLIGTAGAVEGETDVVVYEDLALSSPVMAGISLVNGSFNFSILDNRADVNNKIYVTSRDANGNESEAIGLINDITPPVATIAAEPILGNAATTKIKFTVTSNELWPISSGKTGKVLNGVTEIGSNILIFTGPTGTGPFIYTSEFNTSLLSIADKDVDLTAKVIVTDDAGNPTDISATFRIDTLAPSKVTDLVAVSGNSKVDLSWKNPIADASFAGVSIVRTGSDGSTWKSTALTIGEAFTDTTVTNGTTYTYDVTAVDKAKNESGKTSVTATPSAPAVVPAISAVSTSRVTSTIATETFTPAIEDGEVKSAEIIKDDGDSTEDKGTEVKETKRIPVWGIIFLLILAAIGGYLFYVQNPENSTGKK